MAPKIVRLLPPHITYVEPFGGAAHVLFTKPPSPVEVYNDVDGNLVNFFRVLRDPEKSAELQRRLQLTPYSREEFYYCRSHYQDPNVDDVERARMFFVVVRQAFAARTEGPHWGYNIRGAGGKTARSVTSFARIVDVLHIIAQRFRLVQVEHDDYRVVMTRYSTADTLCYCDPPYHPDTRRAGRYSYDFTHDDHVQLVEFLLQYPCMVVLSGYDHPVYHQLDEAGWKRLTFRAHADSAGRTRGTGLLGKGATDERHQRTEVVWLNPPAWHRLQSAGLLDTDAQKMYNQGAGTEP